MLETRERNHLELRKQKLDDFILKKRLKTSQVEKFTLEIDPKKLNIDTKFLPKGIESMVCDFLGLFIFSI